MNDHNIRAVSESEEMYLITIARLVEHGVQEPVPISRLASELSIQPVSANQMIHKLAEEDFVEYVPYKGVQLTSEGRVIAQQVLRDRRLWELFLMNLLELPPIEADALACHLEHITPKEVTSRLAMFLDHPSFTSQGLPIPEVNGKTEFIYYLPLTDLAVGATGEVKQLDCDAVTQAFLKSEGVQPGATITILAIGGNGGVLLEVGENHVHLADPITHKILLAVPADKNDG